MQHKLWAGIITSIISGVSTAETVQNHEQQQDVIQLDTMVITTEALSEQQQAKLELQQVSSATNFISAQDLEQQRLNTTEDIFKRQPGIYAKSSGNEGTKISIRGSGINRAPGAHASGLFVLLDDIPFTGPGGTPYELLEPWWLSRVEVLRGAHGFEQGSLALGGAVNYVSKTGQESQQNLLKYEMGSRGYHKYAFSSAQSIDQLDYYLSFNGSTYDGYQQHSAGDSRGISANLGYQIRPDLKTRFYLRYRETEHQTPGRLTKAQIKDHPTAAQTNNINIDAKRIQPGSTWLANKTTWSLEQDGMLQASFAYHDYPMDLQESVYRTKVKYSDLTFKLAYEQPYDLFGLNSIFKTSLRSTTHRPDSGVTESLRFAHQGFDAGTITRQYTYRGSDNVILVGQESEIRPNLWLEAAVAGIYTHRESEVYYPITHEKLSEKQWDFAPRLGLRYELSPNLQIFANAGKSIEPAHPWSMIWGSPYYFSETDGAAAGRQKTPIHLDHQKAYSIEMGGHGEHAWGDWNLSYYYSQLKNELLSVEISPTPDLIISESNASDTVHQGVEFGLTSYLWSNDQWGNLVFEQSYTWSDFRYQHDPIFGKNQLPGLPKHLYQATLKMDFKQGIYAQINTEYASKLPVDYANSFYADAYHIWGAGLGYQPAHKKWNIWLDLKNLGNKHYAATVTPAYNDKAQDMARSTPGEGRAAYAGMSIQF